MDLLITCYEMAVKRVGMFGVSVRKKALTVKMETVILIGKGN
jgi:hypothetical protein